MEKDRKTNKRMDRDGQTEKTERQTDKWIDGKDRKAKRQMSG